MRYIGILLLGVLLGGGAAIFFLGAPRATSVPGVPVRAPDQGGDPASTVVITLDQGFVDAILATTFSGLGPPTFQLSQGHEGETASLTQAVFQAGCANTITLLPESSGVRTGVQFAGGN